MSWRAAGAAMLFMNTVAVGILDLCCQKMFLALFAMFNELLEHRIECVCFNVACNVHQF